MDFAKEQEKEEEEVGSLSTTFQWQRLRQDGPISINHADSMVHQLWANPDLPSLKRCALFSLSLSFYHLHVPSFALRAINWWDSQDNRVWRLQWPLAHIRVGCDTRFGSGTGTCSDMIWHTTRVSAVDAELDLAVPFFFSFFLWRYFIFTILNFLYLLFTHCCASCSHSVVSKYTTSVTGKLVAWSGFHIIEAVPKSHSRQHQYSAFWCL